MVFLGRIVFKSLSLLTFLHNVMRFILLLIILWAFPAIAEQTQSFDDWLKAFKAEAVEQGIDQQVVDNAFVNVEGPSQNILDLDRKQPEGTRTFDEYVYGVVTKEKIAEAKKQWKEHRKVLKKIEAKYHVPVPVILALWGMESNFGRIQGNYNVVDSLATLAYDGRRSQLFRSELLAALRMLQDENINYEDMVGSWAGAMGQTQFMPSSFLKFAVDFDGDGRKDIWDTDADALASIANYFHSKNWKYKAGWGIKVDIPDDTDLEEWRSDKEDKPLKEWNELGFRLPNGRHLPRTSTPAHLVIPEDGSAVFLVFPNYRVIMDWNRSIYFATSVGLLADAIGRK